MPDQPVVARASELLRRIRNSIWQRRLALFGLLVCLILLFILRGDWLLSTNSLNPDEAQLLAAGRQASHDFIPYQTYTTYTYLFLWPIFLGVLDRLGVPLTFLTAHVLDGLFDALFVTIGWYLIAKQYGWRFAALIVVPGAVYLFLGAGQQTDMFSLESETLPIVIIFLVLLVMFLPVVDLSRHRFWLGSSLCGLSILAKPQLGPLALSVVLGCVLLRALEASSARSEATTAGIELRQLGVDAGLGLAFFALPSAFALLCLALTGEIHNFIVLGLGGTAGLFSYLSASNAPPLSLALRLQLVGNFVAPNFLVFGWAIGGLIGWGPVVGRRHIYAIARTTAWALPIVSTGVTFFVLEQQFPHYSNILFGSCMASGVMGARLSRVNAVDEDAAVGDRVQPGRRLFVHASVVALVILVAANTGMAEVNGRNALDEVGRVITLHGVATFDPYNSTNSALPVRCPPGSTVFVFGWANELYAYYNWTPASEFLVENPMWDMQSPNATEVKLVESELAAKRPTCVLQAIGEDFFGSIPVTDTIKQVLPRLYTELEACYHRRNTTVGISGLGYTGEDGQDITYWFRRVRCGVTPGSPS